MTHFGCQKHIKSELTPLFALLQAETGAPNQGAFETFEIVALCSSQLAIPMSHQSPYTSHSMKSSQQQRLYAVSASISRTVCAGIQSGDSERTKGPGTQI